MTLPCGCDNHWDDLGEVVRHRLTGWVGIIVGERDYSAQLSVNFANSAVNHGIPFTLEVPREVLVPFDDDEGGGGGGLDATADNVIPVNFTKRVKLNKDTPTGGAA